MTDPKSKITEISAQKRKNRVNIYVDGKFFAGIDNNILVKYNLYKGKEVDRDKLNAILYEEEKFKAKDYAYNLISYRMRTEKEMTERMERKGYNPHIIKEVVKDLEGLGLIDDEKFAEMWVKERIKIHPRSNFILVQELFRKGIDIELAKRVVEKIVDMEVRHKMIRQLIEKAEKRYKNEDREKRKRLILSYLSRRGFSYEEISKYKIG